MLLPGGSRRQGGVLCLQQKQHCRTGKRRSVHFLDSEGPRVRLPSAKALFMAAHNYRASASSAGVTTVLPR